jgi:hypothetical protein
MGFKMKKIHVFSHDYFLHMWHVSKSINYELNEYKQLAKKNKINQFPCNLLLNKKWQDFEILIRFFYSQVDLTCCLWFAFPLPMQDCANGYVLIFEASIFIIGLACIKSKLWMICWGHKEMPSFMHLFILMWVNKRGMLWNCFQLWFEKILRILWRRKCFWNYHMLFNFLDSPCIFLKLLANTF